MRNFTIWPAMWLAPAAGVGGALLASMLMSIGRAGPLAFLASSASFTGVILTAGFALFPFILPSSSEPAAGLTRWDASSSHLTLWIMLLVTLILLPIVTRLYRLGLSRDARQGHRRSRWKLPPTPIEESGMWYRWVLGLGLACTFGILNARWFGPARGSRADSAIGPCGDAE